VDYVKVPLLEETHHQPDPTGLIDLIDVYPDVFADGAVCSLQYRQVYRILHFYISFLYIFMHSDPFAMAFLVRIVVE
jgi:hypothetical protein